MRLPAGRAVSLLVAAALASLALRPAAAAFPAAANSRPHPAVARIIVPESSATSYGTGTLIDVRDQYGLVVTNWHVVRDGTAPPEVVFPNGFRSQARPLKLDANWDLAALVIWRPPIEPVTISRDPPRPGERLTICGYGPGNYRAVSGRCTQYFAPRVDYPQELVELDVEARQGDSGGPIFNDRGELAGVLFGAGRGTTMGSYGGRVHSFLASLAPDIGQEVRPQAPQEQIARLLPPQEIAGTPEGAPASTDRGERSHDDAPRPAAVARLAPIEPAAPAGHVARRQHEAPIRPPRDWIAPPEPRGGGRDWTAAAPRSGAPLASVGSSIPETEPLSWRDLAGATLLQQLGTLLAVLGAIALIMKLARLTSA